MSGNPDLASRGFGFLSLFSSKLALVTEQSETMHGCL